MNLLYSVHAHLGDVYQHNSWVPPLAIACALTSLTNESVDGTLHGSALALLRHTGHVDRAVPFS